MRLSKLGPIQILFALMAAGSVAFAAPKDPKTLICNGELTGDGWRYADRKGKPVTLAVQVQMIKEKYWPELDRTFESDPQAALQAALNLAQWTPNDPVLLGKMSRLYLRLKEKDKALTTFQEAAKRVENSEQAIELLKQILDYPALPTAPISVLVTRFKTVPVHAYALQIYVQKKAYPEAIGVLGGLLKLRSTDADLRYLKAELLFTAGQNQAALAAVREFEAMFQSHAARIADLKIRILLRLGQYSVAFDESAKLPAGERRSSRAAQALAGLKHYREAIALLEAVPPTASLYWLKAKIYFQAGDMASAKKNVGLFLENTTNENSELWAIAGMIKIDMMGSAPSNALLTQIFHRFGQVEALRLVEMVKRLDWDFIAQKVDLESEPVSIQNSFWSRLYDSPVNGQTRRSTF